MRLALAFVAAAVLASASLAWCQTAEPTEAPPIASTNFPAANRIPAGTLVSLELVTALSSATAQRDQDVALRLAEPIQINGVTVIAAGAEGGGVVLDAAPRHSDGRPGKLVIAGRYLLIGGERIQLRGAQLLVSGDHATYSIQSPLMVLGSIPVAVTDTVLAGDDIVIPAGARIPGWLGGAPTDETSTNEQGPSPQNSTTIPPGQGRVVFFRQDRREGRARDYPLRTAELTIGPLRNASFLNYDTSEGIYEFASGNGQETLRFKVEAGFTYYVEWMLAEGALLMRPVLRPSSQAAFEAALPELTPSGP